MINKLKLLWLIRISRIMKYKIIIQRFKNNSNNNLDRDLMKIISNHIEDLDMLIIHWEKDAFDNYMNWDMKNYYGCP